MANTGGTITVLWAHPTGATVTLTGPTFSPTSPQTLVANQAFVTTADGNVDVAITYRGRSIFSGSYFLQGGARFVIAPGPTLDGLLDGFAPVLSTTAALAAIGNAINTADKYTGKLVLNTTTGILVSATDGTAGGVWRLCSTGATTHTPV